LLAELSVILDRFFISTTSDYKGVIGQRWWGATKWRQKHMLCSYTSFMDPLVVEMAQKVVKSVDVISLQSCVRPYSSVAFVYQPSETTEYKLGIHGR